MRVRAAAKPRPSVEPVMKIRLMKVSVASVPQLAQDTCPNSTQPAAIFPAARSVEPATLLAGLGTQPWTRLSGNPTHAGDFPLDTLRKHLIERFRVREDLHVLAEPNETSGRQ